MRRRIVHIPELLADKRFAGLNAVELRTWLAIYAESDDGGVLPQRPHELAAQAHQHDHAIRPADCPAIVRDLIERHLILAAFEDEKGTPLWWVPQALRWNSGTREVTLRWPQPSEEIKAKYLTPDQLAEYNDLIASKPTAAERKAAQRAKQRSRSGKCPPGTDHGDVPGSKHKKREPGTRNKEPRRRNCLRETNGAAAPAPPSLSDTTPFSEFTDALLWYVAEYCGPSIERNVSKVRQLERKHGSALLAAGLDQGARQGHANVDYAAAIIRSWVEHGVPAGTNPEADLASIVELYHEQTRKKTAQDRAPERATFSSNSQPEATSSQRRVDRVGEVLQRSLGLVELDEQVMDRLQSWRRKHADKAIVDAIVSAHNSRNTSTVGARLVEIDELLSANGKGMAIPA